MSDDTTAETAETPPPALEVDTPRRPKDAAAEDSPPAPLWLLTFTDVMALMLTFFVLLYAMSSPQKEKWEGLSQGIADRYNDFDVSAFLAGSQDVIAIDRVQPRKAHNLVYLRNLIVGFMENNDIQGVEVFENKDRLILSFPSEMLFQSGSATMGDNGQEILFSLSGVLRRIKNRLEVVGHTDPDPVAGGRFDSNWDLSLMRAAAVAQSLAEVGYDRDVTVRGLATARYDEMPATVSRAQRYDFARRVDLVLMPDRGIRGAAFDD